MLIYIYMFLISCVFIAISERISNKLLKKIFEIIGLLLPCILAGLRATNIGTDVEVYVKPLFYLAESSNSWNDFFNMKWFYVWKYKYVSDFELLFNIMIYIITKMTNNIQMILFTIQALIVFPIYVGLKKYPQLESKKWMSMLFFYLIFYNISYNAMRQFISIAFVFLGTSCLINEQKGTLKFFISLLVGYFFHTSALLGIIIFTIYKILKQNSKSNFNIKIGKNNIKIQKLFLLGIAFISIIAVFNSSFFTNALSFLGLDYYNGYIKGNIFFNIFKIIKSLPIIIIFLMVIKKFTKDRNSYFYILIFVLEILVSFFSSVNVYAVRISYIFKIFSIVYLPLMIESSEYKLNKVLYSIILIGYMGVLWYYDFGILGANETIPYVFFW